MTSGYAPWKACCFSRVSLRRKSWSCGLMSLRVVSAKTTSMRTASTVTESTATDADTLLACRDKMLGRNSCAGRVMSSHTMRKPINGVEYALPRLLDPTVQGRLSV